MARPAWGRPIGVLGFAALAALAAGYVTIGAYPAAVAYYLVSRTGQVNDPASMHECTVCGGAWVRAPELVRFAQRREERTRKEASTG